MTVSPDKAEFRFEVAISFAGTHRDKVRAIAERLSAAIDPGIEDRSKGRVFFDEWFRHEILGPDMEVLLQRIYHKQTLMPVADLSEDYANRRWTQAEARGIRALRMDLDTARDETARLRILNVRFDAGDVPGVLDTEGWMDGIDLSAEEIADEILKRRELLRARLSRSLALPMDREGEAPAEPPAIPPKGWVWHSTLASRAADQISVLAVVETVLAIVLYWWIALRFETHWHLVSSVFIAPLLLLRSPESMAAGVRWFLKDSFGLGEYETWPRGKRFCALVVTGLITGGLTYCFANELSHRWLAGFQGWPLLGWSIVIGSHSISVGLAVAVAIAGAGAIPRANAATRAGLRAFPVGIASTRTIAIAVVGAVLFSPVGAGFAFRALVFRVLATLSHLAAGVRRLPANWRENHFLTDSGLPAEVMPGIRDREPGFSSDVLLKFLIENKDLFYRIVVSAVGIYLFVPAFLYRLNIKATAWFWWPLAYLLKPAPAASAEAQQRQAVCWPWSNPAQRAWIGLSIGLALLALVLHALVATSRIESDLVTRWPLAARVLLGWGWQRLEVWHWAQGIIAVSGVGMLLLAGNACSQHSNGNWSHYRQSWPQDVRCMTALSRVRLLATVALLVMALGALLLQDRSWQAYVPVPANWVAALEDFYQSPP